MWTADRLSCLMLSCELTAHISVLHSSGMWQSVMALLVSQHPDFCLGEELTHLVHGNRLDK